MAEVKFTSRGLRHAIKRNKSQNHATNFDEIFMVAFQAIAGNSGWAGLLPEATAIKAIETAVHACNLLAELASDYDNGLLY